MERLDELLEEISIERNYKKSQYLEDLIEEVFEEGCYDLTKIEKKFHCNIYTSVEKHNALQFTLYHEITSDLINGELNLEIESGINNGTQLNDYSFENSLEPQKRVIQVIKDIVLDEGEYEEGSFLKQKAQAILNRDKHLIFEYIRKNNYDGYVTGGNSKMKPKGLWTELRLDYIYEEVEVDPNFV
jgi:hypothetical protein